MYRYNYNKRLKIQNKSSAIPEDSNQISSDSLYSHIVPNRQNCLSSPTQPIPVPSSSITKRVNNSFYEEDNPFLAHISSLKSDNSVKRRKSGLFDRFIAQREGDLATDYKIKSLEDTTIETPEAEKNLPHQAYNQILKNEILEKNDADSDQSNIFTSPIRQPVSTPKSPLLNFKSPNSKRKIYNFEPGTPTRLATSRKLKFTTCSSSLLSPESMRILGSPRKIPRQIPKAPYKVLDAPDLQDDFYLNLVDWGAMNTLGVGLGSCVYLWSAQSSQVTKLCDLAEHSDTVTSVNWNPRGNILAIGTGRGYVQLYDAHTSKMTKQFSGHSARVGSLSWNGELLSSGSRDRMIFHHDHRTGRDLEMRLEGHKQEVCGLKWNNENTQLASGGNDNKLFIWDKSSTTPTIRFSEHEAAVKAIAWSPLQHGLLASGGGTADRHIRFWNTLNSTCLSAHDTGSQVCNLYWSKTSNELVSTHGYSQNQVVVWKYPSMTQLATLTGHTLRVLYLAMSPDGQNIVTGAGDETLRFWNVFSKGKTEKEESQFSSALTIR